MGFYFECPSCLGRTPVSLTRNGVTPDPSRECEACDEPICDRCEEFGLCQVCVDEEEPQ